MVGVGRHDGVDRWMLPGALLAGLDGATGPGPARTPRDWAVDVVAFALSVLVWVIMFEVTVVLDTYTLPTWLQVLDPVLGAVACAALWWRREFPVATGVLAVLILAVSNTATGAAFVLLFSLAVHRGWRYAVPALVAGLVLGIPYIFAVFPAVYGDPLLVVLLVVLQFALIGTAGLAVRARRGLVWALRGRAEAERREHERELEAVRRAERARIAREMHDVLAHRISLLSVQAGAVEYRTAMAAHDGGPAMTAAEVGDAVGAMRATAHAALEELQDVLWVLRSPDGTTEAPQPTARQLPALLGEARQGGQVVQDELAGDLEALRPQVQRTVYRFVQEGLTNARKHAPGAVVAVRVRADADHGGVDVEVVNALPVAVSASEIPGAGAGLTGLAEQVALLGGELTREVGAGRFRLRARIPT